MNLNQLLNGVLSSVGKTASQSGSDLGGLLGSVLNGAKNTAGEIKAGNADTITKVGGSAALIGVLSMVLGKNGGSNLAKLGSLATLGGLAYKAYQEYQKSQGASSSSGELVAFEQEPSEQDTTVILHAMIAAALADGELDEQEQAILLKEAGSNAELQRIMANPSSVEDIARTVGNNQALAAQVYLSARFVCQELSRKEIVFLANLAEALNLNEQLVEQLEKQAGF